jgi:hypothetical protein
MPAHEFLQNVSRWVLGVPTPGSSLFKGGQLFPLLLRARNDVIKHASVRED